MRFPLFIVVAIGVLLSSGHLRAQPFEALEDGLDIHAPDGLVAQNADLAEAMRKLHIPSADVALIENGRLAWSHTFGTAPDNAIYQAASLSKLVTAVAALRLVDRGVLDLDRDVNDYLTGWRVPDNDFTRDHPMTLRQLLSMTAGVGVPGYLGYEPGQKRPTLQQILDGTPPANSPPVRVEAIPGSRYAYSGERHELPGGWRVVPELAAGGLWTSAMDFARLSYGPPFCCVIMARAVARVSSGGFEIVQARRGRWLRAGQVRRAAVAENSCSPCRPAAAADPAAHPRISSWSLLR
jgi:Beta-lactamase